MRWHSILAASSLVAAVSSQSSPGDAFITIEASHGGAGNGLTNTSVDVPLNVVYNDSSILAEVSYLFLTSATGVPLESITCTPYRYANGTGTGGQPFNSTHPSLLSTNTVQVGSIVCISNSIQESPASSTKPTSSAPTSGTIGAMSTTTGNLTLTGGPIVPVTPTLLSSYSRVTPEPQTGTANATTSALQAANSTTQVTVLTASQSGNPTARSTVTSVAVVPASTMGSGTSATVNGQTATAAASTTPSPTTASGANPNASITVAVKVFLAMWCAWRWIQH